MYEELIKRLRVSCESCKLWDGYKCCLKGECSAQKSLQAADAIEQLTKERDKWMATAKDEREAYWHWFDNYQKDVPCWIPVTERLPEDEESVLVVRKFLGLKGQVPPSTYTEIAYRVGDGWVADSDEYKIARNRHTDPIYWMPLPQPPVEDIPMEYFESGGK